MLFWNEQGLLREGYETDIQKLKRNCWNWCWAWMGNKMCRCFEDSFVRGFKLRKWNTVESLLVDFHSNAAGFGSVFKTHTSTHKNHATAKKSLQSQRGFAKHLTFCIKFHIPAWTRLLWINLAPSLVQMDFGAVVTHAAGWLFVWLVGSGPHPSASTVYQFVPGAWFPKSTS